MLNSKELLEQTGISRATLNNYIALGIVPKPEVLPPEPQDGAAPRIGYFPEDTVQRIAQIQRLKNEGWSMAAIAEHFAGTRPLPARAAALARPAAAQPGGAGSPSPDMPRLPVQDIADPAYLVDHDFALLWVNPASMAVLGSPEPAASVFRALLAGPLPTSQRDQVLRFQLGHARQGGAPLVRIAAALSPEHQVLLRRLNDGSQPARGTIVSHVPVAAEGSSPALSVYAVKVREGLLFVHVPAGAASPELSALLESRARATGEVARPPRPILSDVTVLAMDLQDATRIWSALPAEEYFELINQIWVAAEPVIRRHHGTTGKHPGDGIVCYFLPQPGTNYVWNALLAAHELREAMRRVSKEWQLRKGWTTELYMNAGLDEGQQWLGRLNTAGQAEFTMFGDTLNRAARISDFARFGAIWATKNLVVKLTAEQRHRLKYGVHRRDREGRHVFVASVFSTVDRLAERSGAPDARGHDIARLPITEIVDIAPDERAAHPHTT